MKIEPTFTRHPSRLLIAVRVPDRIDANGGFHRRYWLRLLWFGVMFGLLALPLLAASPKAAKPKPLMFQTTTPAEAHSVTLTWTDADFSSANPITFNVLRYNGACASGVTFASIATGVTVETYKDTAVSGGQTFCYEVEAVGQNGAVSGPSNTAAGAVPPFPPAVTATAQ